MTALTNVYKLWVLDAACRNDFPSFVSKMLPYFGTKCRVPDKLAYSCGSLSSRTGAAGQDQAVDRQSAAAHSKIDHRLGGVFRFHPWS